MRKQVLVVFDGTSHYIIHESEYNKDTHGEIIGRYYNEDYAQKVADRLNVQAIDPVH